MTKNILSFAGSGLQQRELYRILTGFPIKPRGTNSTQTYIKDYHVVQKEALLLRHFINNPYLTLSSEKNT